MIQTKELRGRTESRRLIWYLSGIFALCFAIWLFGLGWFVTILPSAEVDLRPTDAIVVLTGGRGRVRQGLDLLAKQHARKLFISGVYRGVDVRELLRISQQSPEELACCIALGYEADSTYGNAVESAGWMHQQGLRSLRLVTADYHMPRSLLEFRRIMPEIEIVPHPVFPELSDRQDWRRRWVGASHIVREYIKYLIALVVRRPAWQAP